MEIRKNQIKEEEYGRNEIKHKNEINNKQVQTEKSPMCPRITEERASGRVLSSQNKRTSVLRSST